MNLTLSKIPWLFPDFFRFSNFPDHFTKFPDFSLTLEGKINFPDFSLTSGHPVLVIPRNRWLHLNMTEKLFTGTLNNNQKQKKIKKVNFEKNQQTTKKHEKLPSMQWVKHHWESIIMPNSANSDPSGTVLSILTTHSCKILMRCLKSSEPCH